jgi:hypothetical protein
MKLLKPFILVISVFIFSIVYFTGCKTAPSKNTTGLFLPEDFPNCAIYD